MDYELKRDIIKASNSIRRKYKALRTGRVAEETKLEDTFKPITLPLKELVKRTKNVENIDIKPEIKSEVKVEPVEKMDESYDNDDDEFETPKPRPLTQKVTKWVSTPRGREAFVKYDNLGRIGELGVQYLKTYMSGGVGPSLDTTYGVYYDNDTNSWLIGNSTFRFEDNDINIKGKTYKGTSGLYELIFMKEPNKREYTPEDLDNYKNILIDTSAHKRYYDEKAQINGNRSYKYKEIISKLFREHSGSGLMKFSNREVDYVHWDDPNELVDRLRLLIASQQAGHNNHSNEIVSIIEELREANIVV